jgi:hypothetical protein
VDRATEARCYRLDEQSIDVMQRASLSGLDIQNSPYSPVDEDWNGELGVGISARIADDVVRVHTGVVDKCRDARSGHPSVDAFRAPLLGDQKLGHHVSERTAGGEQPQYAVAVEALRAAR